MCRKGAAKSSKKRAPPPQRGGKEKRGERRGRISAPGAPPFFAARCPFGASLFGETPQRLLCPRRTSRGPAAPAPSASPAHWPGTPRAGKKGNPPFPFFPALPCCREGDGAGPAGPFGTFSRETKGRPEPVPHLPAFFPAPHRAPFSPVRTCRLFCPVPHRAPFSPVRHLPAFFPVPHLPFSPSAAPRTLFPPCGTCREGPGAGGAGPARPHTPKPPACRAGAPAGLPPKKCGEAPLRARGGEPLFVAVCIGYSFFASARPSSSSSRKKRAMWKPSAAAWCSSSATGISTLSPRLT